ncbi:hypothetical protein F7642_12165 [Tenacibaculum finnmarkense genomovar ulcerans]|uniref:hypothetical protein n=1 Tax=Tenacibaculum finnmarkense TaxID=2781243 RepID=UPI001A7ED675|nr:hypothetical protein [Tenacibaculum finnmarkense]MBE7635078.1 hypothetical protein [Tenacibaculum finnmarkense genomovar ulcerans]MCD8430995.1 hypothetical protein [Tenacibaculum finnmarkense genomovar ulcerans]WCC41161.1 hypothetical protein PJJ26_00630 [Tenacibaculum finnmarkense]
MQYTAEQQQIFNQLDSNSKNEKIGYALSTKLKLPHIIYINDLLDNDYSLANPKPALNHYNLSELNNYILGNGTYKMKFILYPDKNSVDGLIHQKDLDELMIEILRFTTNEKGFEENVTTFQKFQIEIEEPVAYLVKELEFTIADLPYKIKGWSESQDLRKMDTKQLEKEVLVYYNYLWNLLNDGKMDVFVQEESKIKYLEAAISTYANKKEYYQMLYDNINNDPKTKGNMFPIENYRLAIEGEGRLVKLYRIDKENFNWNVLIRKDKKEKASTGVRLHKPKGATSFEVIVK